MQTECKINAGIFVGANPPIRQTVTVKGVMFIKVEAMPLDAKIIGVVQGDEVIDFVFKPNRIEVHDDLITFLDSHRNSDNGFTAEVSFKRGAILKVEVK
ncbi:hypothetical protein HAZELMIKA_63 [Klebsiella phage vB_KaeD_HazelMika]|nr:hypothetical protein HAZELMIKA_63 [Klebsiella phage vB_KaeD_HazelMika]